MKDKVREYLKINKIVTTNFKVFNTKFNGKMPLSHKCKVYYIHINGESIGKCVVIGYRVSVDLIKSYVASHVFNGGKDCCPEKYRESMYNYLYKEVQVGTINDLIIGYL